VKALKEMRQVADYINEKKREAEALSLVVRIQDAIHNLARRSFSHSSPPSQSFVRSLREAETKS
jgi:hypothetical protein